MNKPVAWIWEKQDGYTSIETHSLDDEDMKNVGIKSIKPLYTNPPQRTWVGLTNDELTDLFYNENLGQQSAVGQAIALLKERNS